MLHNSPPLHELPQGFSCVRQVLYRERFPAPDHVPTQIQKTTGKARQTRGSVGVRELALKEPPLPSFHRFLTDSKGQVHHLAVGAGKDSNIYVVNRDNMGKFNPNNDNAIYQKLAGALPGGVWANPAYFNNTVYYGPVGNPLKAFPIGNAMLASSPSSQSSISFEYPGTSPAVSANGISNGIV